MLLRIPSKSLGYSRDELLSKTIHDIDPSFTSDQWARHWESLKEHGSMSWMVLESNSSRE